MLDSAHYWRSIEAAPTAFVALLCKWCSGPDRQSCHLVCLSPLPTVPCPSDGAALSAVAALREHRVRALAAAAQLGNVARVAYLVVSGCVGQNRTGPVHGRRARGA